MAKYTFKQYGNPIWGLGHKLPRLQRQLGVTYKCAWRMCHELRKLMASADYQGPLGGPGLFTFWIIPAGK